MNGSAEVCWGPADGVLCQDVPDGSVLLSLVSGEYFELNLTGTVLWRAVEHRSSLPELVDRLCLCFSLSKERAMADTREFLRALLDAGLIVPQNGASPGRAEYGKPDSAIR